jgi:predicted ATPase
MLGQNLLWMGELSEAQQHLRRGSELYDAAQHHSLAARYSEDPGVVCLAWEALALFILGYPDQSLQRSREAVALAKNLADSFSLVQARILNAYIRLYRDEARAAQEETEGAIALAREHDFPFYVAFSTILWGWALAGLGKVEEGILQMRQGLTDYRATGAALGVPDFLARLAEAHGKGNQSEPDWALLDEAFALIEQNDERWYEAEVYRIKGELTLQQEFQVEDPQSACPLRRGAVPNPQSEAETCFRKAIAVAQRQHAKSWELRATISLARLWQQQGKKEEAHQMLAEIYGWFTEGFGTKDLQEAKALLDELS